MRIESYRDSQREGSRSSHSHSGCPGLLQGHNSALTPEMGSQVLCASWSTHWVKVTLALKVLFSVGTQTQRTVFI